jgi:hypothetical protein
MIKEKNEEHQLNCGFPAKFWEKRKEVQEVRRKKLENKQAFKV